jgi:hypothetical protein
VNLDLLERHILAERSRRMGEAIARQWRRPGGVPWIIVDENDDGTDRRRQLAAHGNPEFAVVWVIVHPPADGEGVGHGMPT